MERKGEFIYIIDGLEYDWREEGDRRHIENILKEEKQEPKKKKIIYEEKEGWDCPLNTVYLSDKKMDYEVLAIMTLFSNRKGEEVCEDISEVEYHRYLYEKGDNSIWSNREKMEQLSQNSIRNIKRGIKKLAECDNDVVVVCQDERGKIYYKIYPYAREDKNLGINGTFITIDSRILEYLINVGNSNTIKVYCVLKWLCKNGERQLTRDFLAKQIGLSIKSGKNLNTIGDILYSLDDKLIKLRKETESIDTNEGTKVKTHFYISLLTTEEFLNKKRKK